MKPLALIAAFTLVLTWALAARTEEPPGAEDPYLWLEDVTGEKALAWVRARNAESEKELAGTPAFAQIERGILEILDSKERIPSISKAGPWFYNFWRDERNPRGLWRRTTLAEYRKPDPKWEVVLDLDALGKAEGRNWVWGGAQILRAGGWRRALVSLSPGGSDAVVVREFDIESRSFVKGGFELPEAKSEVSWIDRDHIYVNTDFGPGSMTTSGYPRIGKRWRRGTPLASASTVFEGKETDVSAGAFFDDTKGFERHFAYRSPGFYETEVYLLENGKARRVEVPLDSNVGFHREWLLVELRSPWTVNGKTYPAGALLASRFSDYMKGKRQLVPLFEPTDRTSLVGASWTRNHLILNVLEDVKNRLTVLTPARGEWTSRPLAGAPGFATVSAQGSTRTKATTFHDYQRVPHPHQPPGRNSRRHPGKLKELPAFFDASGLEVSQHFALSKDGTRVPYFQVARKGIELDGNHPTLLYGYGGFEISMTPDYNPRVGLAWLARGGVYVVANIRGGGEYGPRWHQAALREKRPRAYEDFAAVAEDLFARKLTSPARLGTMGGSNGGLLMGNMITLYPGLFGAVVCQVPLLDMKRYSKLLAGASWMAEYGDPDKPEDWSFIQGFSPYHNVKPGAKYPPVLFTTSTRDDRVHPGHARKMMAKMKEMGFDVRYYENIEGGHGGAADNAQAAYMNALAYTFLWQKLQ